MRRDDKASDLDRHASAYGDAPVYSLDNQVVLKWCTDRISELASGESLLELGLGMGITARAFSRAFARYLVIEGSDEVIRRFHRRNRDLGDRIEIVRTLFEEFDTDERFGHIIMGFVLEHVDDPASLLESFKRYLRPGGTLFATVPNAAALNRRIGHAAGMLGDLEELSEFDRALGHQRNWPLAKWRALVEATGYSCRRIEGVFLKPIATQQMIDLELPDEILQAMCQVGIDYPELCLGILFELEPKC